MTPLTKVVDGKRMNMTQPEETLMRAEWAENAAKSAPLRMLPRWAFMAVVEDTPGLSTQIAAVLAALPPGPETKRARAKWKHANEFRADAPEMITLKEALGMTDAAFADLWAQGEALL